MVPLTYIIVALIYLIIIALINCIIVVAIIAMFVVIGSGYVVMVVI